MGTDPWFGGRPVRLATTLACGLALLAAPPAAAAIPAGNLLGNPGAEEGEAATDSTTTRTPPRWPSTNPDYRFSQVRYDDGTQPGLAGFPTTTMGSSIGGGNAFFAGGPGDAVSDGEQVVSVAGAATEIDAGRARATLGAYLGGYDTQGDRMQVGATFRNGAGQPLGAGIVIGPVTNAQRNDQTKLLPREASATVPAGTRSVAVKMVATREGSGYNDGYADNVRLQLSEVTAPPPPPPPGAGPPVASFTAPSSVKRYARITFNAGASRNAAHFLWDLDGDGGVDVDCPGESPLLTTRFASARNLTPTLTVQALDGQAASASQAMSVVGAIRGRGAAVRSAASRRLKIHRAYLCAADGPRTADVTARGGPPPGCVGQLSFGLVSAVGCFAAATKAADVPGPEKPILDEAVRAFNETADVPVYVTTACNLIFSSSGLPIPICTPTVHDRGDLQKVLEVSDVQVSKQTVRINGLDFHPIRGASIVLYPQINRVMSSNAVVTMGDIPVRVGQLNLDVESKPDESGAAALSLGRFDARQGFPGIGGFKVDGQMDVQLERSTRRERNFGRRVATFASRMSMSLKLPSQFALGNGEAPSGRVAVTADNEHGLNVDNAHVFVPVASLGALTLRNVFFDYEGRQDRWDGGGEMLFGQYRLKLSPPPSENGIGFLRGQFNHAGGRFFFGAAAPQVFPGVFLNSLGFAMGLDPTRLRGDAGLDVARVVGVEGTVLAVFASPRQPYTLSAADAGGTLRQLAGRTVTTTTVAAGGEVAFQLPGLGRVPVGNGYVAYIDPGLALFGGAMQWKVVGIGAEANFDGAINIPRRAFNIEGNMRVCIAFCVGAFGIVSSDGFAACGEVKVDYLFDEAIFRPGIGYHWGDTLPTVWLIDGCKVSPYRVQAARASQSGARTFRKAPGAPSMMIRLVGAGGAPRVSVKAPDGEELVPQADVAFSRSRRIRLMRDTANGATWIGIQGGPAGDYTVTPLGGSPPVRTAANAEGLPNARVRARVTGSGRRRVLRYDILRRAGQRVEFVEEGPAVSRGLGSTAGGRGTLPFNPADGPAGPRSIVARVQLGGIPSERLTAARFRAPGPFVPGATRALVRRTRAALRIAWTRVPGAARYNVVVSRRNGVRLLRMLTARRLQLRMAATESGTVTVQAVTATGTVGRAARARFRAFSRVPSRFQRYRRGTGRSA